MNQEEAKKLFEKYLKDNKKRLTWDKFLRLIYEYFGIENNSELLNEMINDLFVLVDGKGLFNQKDDELNFNEFYGTNIENKLFNEI